MYFVFSFVSKSVSAESVLRYFCRGIFIPVLAPIPQLSGSSQSVTISGLSPPYLPPLGQLWRLVETLISYSNLVVILHLTYYD